MPSPIHPGFQSIAIASPAVVSVSSPVSMPFSASTLTVSFGSSIPTRSGCSTRSTVWLLSDHK